MKRTRVFESNELGKEEIGIVDHIEDEKREDRGDQWDWKSNDMQRCKRDVWIGSGFEMKFNFR